MSGPRFTDRVVNMSLKTIKYFSTLIVAVVAVLAAWWLWNCFLPSPWTRAGKNRAARGSV
ncbi:efflux transporter periplasmic adaptor subunit, partial [Salmonella enterica subsp. enterica serovar Wilhelmsburg]